jgi:hypothetical protein
LESDVLNRPRGGCTKKYCLIARFLKGSFMRLVGFFFSLSMTIACTGAMADDLFDKDGRPTNTNGGSEIAARTTVGGYPIYNDAEGWRLMEIKSAMSGALNGAEPVNRGVVSMWQVNETGATVAQMTMVANLSSVGGSQYMTGEPCAGSHVLTLKKNMGYSDNCLTVDVDGRGAFTYFVVRATQTRSGGRSYFLHLGLGADSLGFPGTSRADWSDEAVQADPRKKALLANMKSWATLLRDGTEKAVEFSKPADAFAGVPSYKTLVVPQ